MAILFTNKLLCMYFVKLLGALKNILFYKIRLSTKFTKICRKLDTGSSVYLKLLIVYNQLLAFIETSMDDLLSSSPLRNRS